MPYKFKIIGMTMGDPAGIGPEICLKTAYKLWLKSAKTALKKLVIFGNYNVASEKMLKLRQALKFNPEFKLKKIELPELAGMSPGDFRKTINEAGGNNELTFVNIASGNKKAVKIGCPSKESGTACYKYIAAAVRAAENKFIDGITTAPISKEALKLAGLKWPGHTEMLGELTGSKNIEMAFYGPRLKMVLATRHLSLKNAVSDLTVSRVCSAIIKAAEYAKLLYKKNGLPVKIIVPAINPHAGECGLFGNNEIEILVPAIKKASLELKKDGYNFEIIGPLPADTAFYKAYHDYSRTVIVALYHDQGLIPFKMLYFDSGVNITLGLPFLRTSPDHGTAYDIADKLTAREDSMLQAVKLAYKLTY